MLACLKELKKKREKKHNAGPYAPNLLENKYPYKVPLNFT